MKDSEFIELLNLYLDHEISTADAVRLEAEVQSNHNRREIYQQYCRMQKACKMLSADFQTDSAPVAAKNVVAFEASDTATAQRRGRSGLYAVGAFAAAAACFAVIFVGRQPQVDSTTSQPSPIVVRTETPQPAESVDRAMFVSDQPPSTTQRGGLVSVAGGRPKTERSKSSLVGNPLLLTSNSQADAALASAMQEANDQLEWLRSVQLNPIQQDVRAETLRFGVQPAVLRPETRSVGQPPAPAEAPVESVGFQFVK